MLLRTIICRAIQRQDKVGQKQESKKVNGVTLSTYVEYRASGERMEPETDDTKMRILYGREEGTRHVHRSHVSIGNCS